MTWPTEVATIYAPRAARRARPARRARSRAFGAEWVGAFRGGFDALRIYGTGAAGDGEAQTDVDAMLGDFRSSLELGSLIARGAMRGVTIQRVSDACLIGTGALEADGLGNLRWTEPASSRPGAWTPAPEGVSVVLPGGSDASAGLRVVRAAGAALPLATRPVILLPVYNGAFGTPNVEDAERAAGSDLYRAIMLRNEGLGAFQLAVYLATLGTPRTVNASGYAASGAVTVTIASGTLKDWPESGFVENEDTGEVLYYSARSSASPWTLTVPAAGRDVWAEVAGGAAGSEDDELYPIPGLRIAFEDPIEQPAGYIQTIASPTTAPTGLTWVHPNGFTDPDTLAEVNFASHYIKGLWIQRRVIAGATARARVDHEIEIDFYR